MTISVISHQTFQAALARDDAEALIASLGSTDSEGLQLKVIEEIVDFTGNAAKFKAMATAVPADSVILSIQANVEELLVGGSTTVKFALGINDGDTDKYGVGAAFTKNTKISTLPDYAVLSAEEQIDVNGVVTAGTSLGDTNLTAGKVRVRVVYLNLSDLADA